MRLSSSHRTRSIVDLIRRSSRRCGRRRRSRVLSSTRRRIAIRRFSLATFLTLAFHLEKTFIPRVVAIRVMVAPTTTLGTFRTPVFGPTTFTSAKDWFTFCRRIAVHHDRLTSRTSRVSLRRRRRSSRRTLTLMVRIGLISRRF